MLTDFLKVLQRLFSPFDVLVDSRDLLEEFVDLLLGHVGNLADFPLLDYVVGIGPLDSLALQDVAELVMRDRLVIYVVLVALV